MPVQLDVVAPPASPSTNADVVVRRLVGAIVVSPAARTPPLALAAVLLALTDCEPTRPVVLDLTELLLTPAALDTVHAGLCGPRALPGPVVLVATRHGSRRRLHRFTACRAIPVYASIDEVVRAGHVTGPRCA